MVCALQYNYLTLNTPQVSESPVLPHLKSVQIISTVNSVWICVCLFSCRLNQWAQEITDSIRTPVEKKEARVRPHNHRRSEDSGRCLLVVEIVWCSYFNTYSWVSGRTGCTEIMYNSKVRMRFHGKCRKRGSLFLARFQIMQFCKKPRFNKEKPSCSQISQYAIFQKPLNKFGVGLHLLHSDLGQIPGIIAECCDEAKPKRIERLPE